MLPIFNSDVPQLSLLQTQWANQLNPVLSFAPVNGLLLKNVSLLSGDNKVNHLLGRKLQGWMLTRVRSSAVVYDKQDSNQMPALTLALNASAPVVVDIWVF
jgi:hypothetical protein